MIRTDKIFKTIKKRPILKDISIHIRKSEIYGLIGKNGAGKSTLLKLIAGVSNSTTGSILYDSCIASGRIGLTLENPGLYEHLTAYENLKAKAIFIGCDLSEIDRILEIISLTDAKNSKIRSFSMGMKQRLAIGLALLGNPSFVIFDEPINGLDPQGIKWFRELVLDLNQKQDITFLISSHILSELELIATRIGIINYGKLVLEVDMEQLREICVKNQVSLEDFYIDIVK